MFLLLLLLSAVYSRADNCAALREEYAVAQIPTCGASSIGNGECVQTGCVDIFEAKEDGSTGLRCDTGGDDFAAKSEECGGYQNLCLEHGTICYSVTSPVLEYSCKWMCASTKSNEDKEPSDKEEDTNDTPSSCVRVVRDACAFSMVLMLTAFGYMLRTVW
eukprot:TRINITY_DN22893_c4_g1_i1.p2 TRINITY_DN22893_c4_g1~~TRINITY_DN22893_c4_g1_i1.p2  ORF type:complete len:161 (+),score=5.82 TRINITY_DN22893_c4_g1_i1:112-594(+)